MAKKEFFLTKWVRGWRLDKFFDNLFKTNEAGEVTVKDAVTKTIAAIDSVLAYEDSVKLISSLLSDNAEASAEQVIETIKGVREQLVDIETLPDIAEGLKDYTFSQNPIVNDYIHDMVSMTALAFNDANISIWEAIGLVTRTTTFIQEKK